MAYLDVSGESSQTGLDGGNTSVGVNTGARYTPPAKDYTIVILAGLAVLALLIYTRPKGK